MSKRSPPEKPRLSRALTSLIAPLRAAVMAPTLLIRSDQLKKPRRKAVKAGQSPAAAAASGSQATPAETKRSPRRPHHAASPRLKGNKVMKAKTSSASRRSAAAIVLAFCVFLSGAYVGYRHLSMPKVHVKHVAKVWLDHSAGIKPQQHVARQHPIRHQATHITTVRTAGKVSHHRHVIAQSKHSTKHYQTLAKNKKKHKKHTKVVAKHHRKKTTQVASGQTSSSYQQTSYSRSN